MGGEILEYEAKTILRKGKEEAQTENIKRMLKMGFTKKQISESLDVSFEMIDRIEASFE